MSEIEKVIIESLYNLLRNEKNNILFIKCVENR